MQTKQTVISLRLGGGGGGNRGSRFAAARLDSSSASISADLLHPHGAPPLAFKIGDTLFDGHELVRYSRDQVLQLREVVVIPETILQIKRELEVELHGESSEPWCLGAVKEVLSKMEDDFFRKLVFDAANQIVSSSPSAQALLETQTIEIEACRGLL